MDPNEKRCSACGAGNATGAERCSQCHTPFPADRPGPATGSGAGWRCSGCGETNDVALSVCATCGSSIFDTFKEPSHRPAVTNSDVLRWSLDGPGLGLAKAGQAVHRFVVAVLGVTALVTGLMLLFTDRGIGAGAFLLSIVLVVWVASTRDALVAASGRPEEMLLRPRILTVLGGLVIVAILLAIVIAFDAQGGGV